MGCNCKLTEIILGIVIIVFTWWQVGTSAWQWIITIAAALLIIHALKCANCGTCASDSMPAKSSGSSKKKKRR